MDNDRLGQTTQYTFAKMLAQGVPVMQNTIKNTVTVELKEWLARYNIKTQGPLSKSKM